MNSQALADRLAELAGWKPIGMCEWMDPRGVPHVLMHGPFPVGSLDAVERWRGKWLKGWELSSMVGPEFTGDPQDNEWVANMRPSPTGSGVHGKGPTEWDARAAALIAAKESKQ